MGLTAVITPLMFAKTQINIPRHSRWVKNTTNPRVLSGVIRRDYLVGISIRPNTPRVKATLYGRPPINWFQKGNKKPRAVGGVQILKDKRLG